MQSGLTVDLSTRSSFEALPVYMANPQIYPVSGSETMNSFMWNRFDLFFEYCRNFTRPLYVRVDSSIDIFWPGLYVNLKLSWHIVTSGRIIVGKTWW